MIRSGGTAMSHVTLLLTRYRLDEFVYDLATGRNNDDIDTMTADERRRFYQLPNGRPRTRISGTAYVCGAKPDSSSTA
jgi:hypothetical protein